MDCIKGLLLARILSELPQDLVLVLVLINIVIMVWHNSFFNNLKSMLIKFADDTKSSGLISQKTDIKFKIILVNLKCVLKLRE